MSLLGCNSKLIWNDLFFHLFDVISMNPFKKGIILCKNFDSIHNELLEIFYSYMQQHNHNMSNVSISFIIITEQISFIPNNILNICNIISVPKPDLTQYENILRRSIAKKFSKFPPMDAENSALPERSGDKPLNLSALRSDKLKLGFDSISVNPLNSTSLQSGDSNDFSEKNTGSLKNIFPKSPLEKTCSSKNKKEPKQKTRVSSKNKIRGSKEKSSPLDTDDTKVIESENRRTFKEREAIENSPKCNEGKFKESNVIFNPLSFHSEQSRIGGDGIEVDPLNWKIDGRSQNDSRSKVLRSETKDNSSFVIQPSGDFPSDCQFLSQAPEKTVEKETFFQKVALFNFPHQVVENLVLQERSASNTINPPSLNSGESSNDCHSSNVHQLSNIKEIHGLLLKEFKNIPECKEDKTKNTFTIICDNIIHEIIHYNEISMLKLRDIIYDILTYNLNIYECIWYIIEYIVSLDTIMLRCTPDKLSFDSDSVSTKTLNSPSLHSGEFSTDSRSSNVRRFSNLSSSKSPPNSSEENIKKNSVTEQKILQILKHTFLFFKYYNNNYRPIYHLEHFFYNVIVILHSPSF
jgi:hypothetical protein